MANNNYETIDEYIALCQEDIQPRLNELRGIILSAAPDLTEKISWKMPTFYCQGNVIHFAAHKKHIGLYPGVEIESFADRLKSYKTSKGAIQIPNDMKFDIQLIKDIVMFNIALNKNR